MEKALTLTNLYSMAAKREGKKHQASYGDIKEGNSAILDIAAEYPEAEALIFKEILKRRMKLAKKKKK